MSTVKRVARNFFSLFTGQIVSNVISFFELVYLARVLNPEYFGKISFAQTVVGYALLFADFGITKIGVRETARQIYPGPRIASSIVCLRLLLSVFFYAILFLLTGFMNKPLLDKNLILLFGLLLFPFALSLDWFFQGKEKMEFAATYTIIKSAVPFFLLVLLLRRTSQVLLVPLFYFIGFLAAAFVLLLAYWQAEKLYFFCDRKLWGEIIYPAIPIGFSILMMEIYYRIDSVMLGLMRTDAEVGYYNASYKLIFAFGALAGLFYQTLFPLISRYWQQSREKLALLLKYATRLMTAIGIPLAVGGFVLADKIIVFIFGKSYLPFSGLALKILIWSVMITFLSYGLSMVMIAANLGKEYAISVFFGALFNLLTNFYFIPRYGIIGAALTTVFTELLIFIWMGYYVSKKVSTFLSAVFFIKPALSAAIMGLIIYLLKLELIISILLGIVIYSLLFFLLKGFSREEYQFILGQK